MRGRNKTNSARKKQAQEIRTYLRSNLDRKVTIRELADHFHISETQVKTCFKEVYGTTVHAWFRSEKMHAAAGDLYTTDLSVLEIAGKYGYDNGSKFASAFRDVFGMPPGAYRLNQK